MTEDWMLNFVLTLLLRCSRLSTSLQFNKWTVAMKNCCFHFSKFENWLTACNFEYFLLFFLRQAVCLLQSWGALLFYLENRRACGVIFFFAPLRIFMIDLWTNTLDVSLSFLFARKFETSLYFELEDGSPHVQSVT